MRVHPLPLEHIVRENYSYLVHRIVLDHIIQQQPNDQNTIRTYQLICKMMIAGGYKTDKQYDVIMNYLSNLSHYVIAYSNTNCFHQMIGSIGRKTISIHIVPRRTITQKIVIQPWRRAIANEVECVNYNKNNFIEQLLYLLGKDVTIDTILSIHVSTNIVCLKRKLTENGLMHT